MYVDVIMRLPVASNSFVGIVSSNSLVGLLRLDPYLTFDLINTFRIEVVICEENRSAVIP